jgi:hypothetical protein
METKNAPPLVHVPVQSSAIESVGYNPHSRLMQVKMKGGGKVYDYPGVDPADHEAFMKSPSMGKHLAAVIRPKYSTAVSR